MVKSKKMKIFFVCLFQANLGSCVSDSLYEFAEDFSAALPPSMRRTFSNPYAYTTICFFIIPILTINPPGTNAPCKHNDKFALGTLSVMTITLSLAIVVSIYSLFAKIKADFVAETAKQSLPLGLEALLDPGSFKVSGGLFQEHLSSLADHLDAGDCFLLAICSAHAEPEKLGSIYWPMQFLMALQTRFPIQGWKLVQEAANHGLNHDQNSCSRQYECPFHPVQVMQYLDDSSFWELL